MPGFRGSQLALMVDLAAFSLRAPDEAEGRAVVGEQGLQGVAGARLGWAGGHWRLTVMSLQNRFQGHLRRFPAQTALRLAR